MFVHIVLNFSVLAFSLPHNTAIIGYSSKIKAQSRGRIIYPLS